MRIWISALAIAAIVSAAKGQTLAPVDISGFGKEHPIEAVVTPISTSECKGATYFRAGESHQDNLAYDVHITAKSKFTNRSTKPALLYKHFNPAMTERVSLSKADIHSGKFVAGFDGDRMAISGEPKAVSIDDFVVLKPGETYTTDLEATVYASADPQKPLHARGKYWVQLGIDARPDRFYYDPAAERASKRKWQSHGLVVDFILSEPFPLDIALDAQAPPCKQ
jgi:hypothetical protein